MELLKLNASSFCQASTIIGQAWVLINRGGDLSTNDAGNMGGLIGEVGAACETLKLPSTVAQVHRMLDWLKTGDSDLRTLSQMLVELQNRLLDDLSMRLFLAVPESQENLYTQDKPLFGEQVEKKFTQMSEDVSEAGKCLALNRNTAAVFHLMRIMELGVQSFGTKLGITLVQEKNWQSILDEVNKNIKTRDHKLPETKRCAETASHLYNVKVAWRNEVMHPKQTYTDEEAAAIFGNVKTFINDLAGLI